jgi:hypothetical protein
MKKSFVLLAAAALLAPAIAGAQITFDQYAGFIPVNPRPLPLATDGTALFYASFDDNGGDAGITSTIFRVADPVASIIAAPALPAGTETAVGTTIETVNVAEGRGLQGLQVDGAGNLYASGDAGGGQPTILRKYAAGTFTPDATFNAATAALTKRVAGIALLPNNLIAGITTSNTIEYFDQTTGSQAGLTSITTGINAYGREVVWNNDDSVLYILKNGNSQSDIIQQYVSGITATGGGTVNAAALITDGATNSAFGGGTQHGFYFDAQNQLITMDSAPSSGLDKQIRVWDVATGGTSLTLDHAILPSIGDPDLAFTDISDAVVIGNRLYVSSTGASVVYVFEQAASVSDWTLY